MARVDRAVAHFCAKERWVEAWDHRDWTQGKIGWLPQWRDALDDQVDHEDPSRLAVIRQARDAIDDYLHATNRGALLIADKKEGNKLAVASVPNDGQGNADGHHQLLHLAALGKGSGAGTVLVGEVMREAGKAERGLIVTWPKVRTGTSWASWACPPAAAACSRLSKLPRSRGDDASRDAPGLGPAALRRLHLRYRPRAAGVRTVMAGFDVPCTYLCGS